MEKATSLGSCRMEIRSVNNRFLEMQVRIPRFLANLEHRIKKSVSEEVSRGSLTISLSCDQADEKGRLGWDKSAVENYLRIFREIQQEFGLEERVSLSHLLQFSDFVKSEVAQLDDEAAWKEIQPVIAGALHQFQQSREAEGKHIVRDLQRLAGQLRQLLKKIEKRAPVRQDAYVRQCRKRIEQLAGGSEAVDAQRMAMEAAFMADKLDISEECSRLHAHLAQFAEALDGQQPAGKRLNFIVQEMNREATTIAAKANDMEIARLSVDLREGIEKMREQIQNIE